MQGIHEAAPEKHLPQILSGRLSRKGEIRRGGASGDIRVPDEV
jgi:hypothetical protein